MKYWIFFSSLNSIWAVLNIIEDTESQKLFEDLKLHEHIDWEQNIKDLTK